MKYPVGVIIPIYAAFNTILADGSPQALRWLYGDYENVLGSSSGDFIIDNPKNNYIITLDGDNSIVLTGGGVDTIDGGSGSDSIRFQNNLSYYS